jgi:hypothetical protein
MSNTWFAGNFCPRNAKCSTEDGALSPSNGPKIQTLVLEEPRDMPYAATVQAFPDEKSFSDAGYNPRDWAKCKGEILPINQHSGLFSLIGTSYGGDGRTTFGLPDLSGEGNGDYYIFLIAIFRED